MAPMLREASEEGAGGPWGHLWSGARVQSLAHSCFSSSLVALEASPNVFAESFFLLEPVPVLCLPQASR